MPFPTAHSLWHSLKAAFFPLLCPVIIIGCIMTGVCTPTEAAIIAVFYALILTLSTRTIRLRELPGFLLETCQQHRQCNVYYRCCQCVCLDPYGGAGSAEHEPWMTDHIDDKIVALLFINLILLIVGTFMETAAAISILVPILMPIALSYGIDPIHFGIMCILNLMLGLLTPPIGMVLYVLSSVSKVPFEKNCAGSSAVFGSSPDRPPDDHLHSRFGHLPAQSGFIRRELCKYERSLILSNSPPQNWNPCGC